MTETLFIALIALNFTETMWICWDSNYSYRDHKYQYMRLRQTGMYMFPVYNRRQLTMFLSARQLSMTHRDCLLMCDLEIFPLALLLGQATFSGVGGFLQYTVGGKWWMTCSWQEKNGIAAVHDMMENRICVQLKERESRSWTCWKAVENQRRRLAYILT